LVQAKERFLFKKKGKPNIDTAFILWHNLIYEQFASKSTQHQLVAQA